MITRITLDNFMSHAHTVIEPAIGLTVITGANNCGKSAVVEALRAVCENTPTDFMVRHGTKEAVVTIETDDGHTVIWRRRKTYASYTIDGEQNDRPADDYLQRVHVILRLPPVDDLQVHFGTQKSPIFLLNESKLKQATFFASSSDAEKLLEMQRLHRARVADDKRTQQRLAMDIAAIDARLTVLEPLPQVIADADALAARFEKCKTGAAAIERATASAASLRRWTENREEQERCLRALDDLAPPPAIHDETPLVQLLQRIGNTRQQETRAEASGSALKSLHPPHTPVESESLRAAIQNLKLQTAASGRAEAVVKSMQTISSPPPMHVVASLEDCLNRFKNGAAKHRLMFAVTAAANSLIAPSSPIDTAPLNQSVAQLRTAAESVARAHLAATTAAEELAETRSDVIAWALENPKCPLCNGAIEADQLLAAGGHAHE